eukprot:Rhum_TRINITY_DN15175_c3_g2::Rhum_TRINITY_DN15175_c3_g2_i2::g.141399::m.141399
MKGRQGRWQQAKRREEERRSLPTSGGGVQWGWDHAFQQGKGKKNTTLLGLCDKGSGSVQHRLGKRHSQFDLAHGLDAQLVLERQRCDLHADRKPGGADDVARRLLVVRVVERHARLVRLLVLPHVRHRHASARKVQRVEEERVRRGHVQLHTLPVPPRRARHLRAQHRVDALRLQVRHERVLLPVATLARAHVLMGGQVVAALDNRRHPRLPDEPEHRRERARQRVGERGGLLQKLVVLVHLLALQRGTEGPQLPLAHHQRQVGASVPRQVVLHLHHPVPPRPHRVRRLLHRACHRPVHREEAVVADHAVRQLLAPGRRRRTVPLQVGHEVVLDAHAGAPDVHHLRHVVHRLRHRARGGQHAVLPVEPPVVVLLGGGHPPLRHPRRRRLETRHAAVQRGDPYAAADVRPDAHRRRARPDERTLPAAGPAAGAVCGVRVARRAPDVVGGLGHHQALRHVAAHERDRAGVHEQRHQQRALGLGLERARREPARRVEPAHVHLVLHRQRHAVQGPAHASGPPLGVALASVADGLEVALLGVRVQVARGLRGARAARGDELLAGVRAELHGLPHAGDRQRHHREPVLDVGEGGQLAERLGAPRVALGALAVGAGLHAGGGARGGGGVEGAADEADEAGAKHGGEVAAALKRLAEAQGRVREMEAERAAAAAAEEENARLREQLEMHGANEDVLKEKTELVRAEFENKLKRAQIEVERMTIDKEHAERDLEDARAVAQKLRASLLAREGADRGGSSGAAGGGASAGAGGQATPHTLPLPPLPPSPRTPRTPRSPTGSAGVAVAEARERSNTPLGETGDGDEFVSSPLHADGAAMNTSDDSTFAGASRGASAPNTSSPKMLQTPPRSDSHASDKAEEGEARCVEQGGVAYRCALLQVSPFEGQRDKAFDMELQEHNNGSVVLLTRWGFVGQPERNCQAHPCASVAAGVQKFCAKFRAKTKNDWQGGAGVAGGASGAAAFVKHPGMYELAAHRGVGAAAEERPQAPEAQASPPQDGWEDEDEDEDEDEVVEAGAAADAEADAEAAQSRVVSPHVPTHPAPPSAAEYDGALAALERQVGEQRLMIEALEGELAQAQEAMKNVLEEQIRREEEAEQNQGASFVLTELQATVEVLEDELQRSRASEHEATQQCAQLRTVASGAESAAQAAASHARRASAEDEARSAAARSRLEAVIAELEARVSEEQRHRRRAEGDVRTLHNALAAEGVRLPQGVAGAPAANGGGGGKGELKTRADEERNFVLKTRADLVSAVWAAHGDVCRIAKAANVRGGGAAGNAPSLKELRLSVRAIVSSFFSPLEKLHHGAAASQFRTDERIAAQFPGLFAAAAPTAQAAGNGGRLRRASASPTPGLARKPSGVAGRAQAQQQQQQAAAAAAAARPLQQQQPRWRPPSGTP